MFDFEIFDDYPIVYFEGELISEDEALNILLDVKKQFLVTEK